MGRIFIPFDRPFAGMTGYYVSTRMWQDRITDADWTADARVGFENGSQFVDGDGNTFTAGSWSDGDVEWVDSALAVLHRATGTTKLLKRADGGTVYLVRYGQGPGYAWNDDSTIGLPDWVFGGGPNSTRHVVFHE